MDVTMQELEWMYNYVYSQDERILYPQIIQYLQTKYDVKIIKCTSKVLESGKMRITAWVNSYKEGAKVFEHAVHQYRCICFTDDENYIKKLIEQIDISNYFKQADIHLSFEIFIYEALRNIQKNAFQDFKKFKENYFNPKTMEKIDSDMMYVVYKTKELMEQAKESGEHEFLREKYYEFIKKYDRFNIITPQKNLLVFFDYERPELSPRAMYDLYWKLIAEASNQ